MLSSRVCCRPIHRNGPVRLPSPMNCERSSSRSRVVSGPESLPPRPRFSRSSRRPRGGSPVEPARPAGWKSTGIASITNLPGNKLDPAYSSDGSAIAFSWRGPDGNSPGIYVLDATPACRAGSHNPVSTTCRRHGRRPEPTLRSSESRQNGVNELIVVPAAGGPERKLRDVRQSRPLADATRPLLTWTADGNAIVIPTLDVDADGRASLFRIGLRGEPPQRLFASTGGDGDSYPAFSPDGRWLAYGLAERASARCSCAGWASMGCPRVRHRKCLAARDKRRTDSFADVVVRQCSAGVRGWLAAAGMGGGRRIA